MTPPSQTVKSGLVRASSLLFLMMMGANVCNYAFHALASRKLGPSEYGVLVSMLALLTLVAVMSQTIQTVVAKWTAVEELGKRYDRIAALIIRVMRRMLMMGAVCLLGLSLLSGPLSGFFQLSSPWPIIAVGVTTIVMLILPVMRGLLQGLQRFNALGVNFLADGFIRIGAGVVIFGLGYHAAGGVLASAIGGALAAVLALGVMPELRRAVRNKLPVIDLSGLKLYSLSVLVGVGSFLVISTLDVILVKHWFAPEAAGYYAAGSIVGKAFLFLPFAIANVLFPKVSAQHAVGENTLKLLIKSLLLTAGILGGGVLLAYFLAPLIILTLFGREFLLPETLWLVRWFGLAVTPLALTFILLQYNLALNNKRFLAWLLGDVLLMCLGLMAFHSRLETVLLVAGINHFVVFIGGLWFLPRKM